MKKRWAVDENIRIWVRMMNLPEIVDDVLLFVDVSVALLAVDRVRVWFQPRSDTELVPEDCTLSVLEIA